MNLSLKIKVIVIYTDLIIVISIFGLLGIFSNSEVIHTWTFRLLMYILYYVVPEYFFHMTIGMKIWKVKIGDSGNKNRFFLYSILIFLDRYIFLVFYLISILMMYNKNFLLSEKLSKLRWLKI